MPPHACDSSLIGPDSSSSSRESVGWWDCWAISVGSVGTPSRRSVPGVLPSSVDSLATSMMSSLSWKAHADLLAELGEGLDQVRAARRPSWRRTAPRWRSASRSCRRRPTGSARAGPRRDRDRRSHGSAPRPAGRTSAPGCSTASGPSVARRSQPPARTGSHPSGSPPSCPTARWRSARPAAVTPRPSRRRGRASRGGSARPPGRPVRRPPRPGSPNSAASRTQQRPEPLAAGLQQVARRLVEEVDLGARRSPPAPASTSSSRARTRPPARRRRGDRPSADQVMACRPVSGRTRRLGGPGRASAGGRRRAPRSSWRRP